MKALFHVLLVSFFSLAILASCARDGFQTLDSNTNPNNGNDGNNGNNNSPVTNPNLAEQIKNLDLQAFISGGSFDGILVVDIDKQGDGQLIFTIPLGITPLFSQVTGAHHKYKDITFALNGSKTSGFKLQIKIPLKYILRLANFESAAPGRLPNGDPLPNVPSGELPMLNISVNPNKKEKIYLYLSKEYVGILFESKFDPGIDFSYDIRDRHDLRTVGYFNLISAKNNAPAAFMASLQFPPEVAALLDDYFMH